MGIVVIGDVFIDVKGYSTAPFIPGGRNAGVIQQIHGGVGRNVVEDIANIELKPCNTRRNFILIKRQNHTSFIISDFFPA